MSEYKICSRCVMDTTDRDIEFNEDGVCNHCLLAESRLPNFSYSKVEEKHNLEEIKRKILSKRKGKYDCLIGVSGGVDSSYVAYVAVKEMGLNPLVVHMDNGWNSEIAVSNINNLVNRLGVDLETYVIDWGEFKDLQRAFIRAGVVDVELLTDQAHKAVSSRIASKYKIKIALTGGNYVTEHGMPKSWYWGIKQDVTNIKAIYSKFKGRRLKTYPFMDTIRYKISHKTQFGLKSIPILNSLNYNKDHAVEVIKSELGWEDYGGKHNESIWTKFYQEYYLPRRFDIDKRRVHYSALIRIGTASRDECLNMLLKHSSSSETEDDFVEYVVKKLGFSKSEFETLIQEPRVEHDYYPSQKKVLERLHKWRQRLKF